MARTPSLPRAAARSADAYELAPCEIDDVLPLVRDRLAAWAVQAPGGMEEILREIRERQTLCWRSSEALIVLSLMPTLDGKRDLFIRAAVSLGRKVNIVYQHIPALEKIARDLDAQHLRFRSRRAGWLRLLGDGWRISHVEYVREVK